MADMVREIQGDPDYAAASDRVLLVYESENDPERIAAHLSFLKAQLPEVKVFGMTLLGPLNEEMVLPEQITVCSLLLFQNITASVVSADLSRTSVGAAAAAFTDAVQGAPLKGVMLLTSAQGEQSADYLDTLAQAFPEVPIFGGQAGAKRLNSEQFYVFDGTQIYLDGAVAVAFCGADLHVHAERVLGWKALGRVHTITKVSDSGAIETIDKKPAMDLYEKYLGLKPDQYFYANNAAFPLLEWTGNSLSARIPFDFTEDGALQMFTPMREGARVSLSYSRKGMLLADAFACAKREAACPAAHRNTSRICSSWWCRRRPGGTVAAKSSKSAKTAASSTAASSRRPSAKAGQRAGRRSPCGMKSSHISRRSRWPYRTVW